MPIINRVSRLFTADLHAVLDRIEEPEILLKQALREMEEEVAANEQQLNALRREHDQWLARRADVERTLPDLDDQIDVCFDSNEETLARALIKRKLETERGAKHIADRCDALGETVIQHEAELAEQLDSLAALREKAELLSEAPTPGPNGAMPGDRPVGDDEVEVAFLREKQRRSAS
jgi:phage shock protein A